MPDLCEASRPRRLTAPAIDFSIEYPGKCPELLGAARRDTGVPPGPGALAPTPGEAGTGRSAAIPRESARPHVRVAGDAMPDPKDRIDFLRDAGTEPGCTEGSAEGEASERVRAGPIEEPGRTRSRAEGEPEPGEDAGASHTRYDA